MLGKEAKQTHKHSRHTNTHIYTHTFTHIHIDNAKNKEQYVVYFNLVEEA